MIACGKVLGFCCVCARAVVQKRLDEIKCADFLTLEMVPWFGCTTLRNKWLALVPLTTGNIDKCSRMEWIQGVGRGIVSFKFFQGQVQGPRATSYPNYMHNDKSYDCRHSWWGSPYASYLPTCQLKCWQHSPIAFAPNLIIVVETHQECRPHYHWLRPKLWKLFSC